MSSRPRPSRPPLGDAPAGENPDLSGADERVEGEDGSTSATLFVPRGVGCRQLPAFKLDFSTFGARRALAGRHREVQREGPDGRRLRRREGRPRLHGAPSSCRRLRHGDLRERPEEEGPDVRRARRGAVGQRGAEAVLRRVQAQPADPARHSRARARAAERRGGPDQRPLRRRLRPPPARRKFLGANVAFRNGDLEALGGDVALPVPVPLFGGAITVTSIGGTFQGEKTTSARTARRPRRRGRCRGARASSSGPPPAAIRSRATCRSRSPDRR